MRRPFVLLLVPVFCLAACFESSVPITSAPTGFDPALVGIWGGADPQGNTAELMILTVRRFDEAHYFVETPENPAEDVKRGQMRAFLSHVDGVTYVNVQDIVGPERGYEFFKLVLHNDTTFSLQLLSLPSFATSSELAAYLRAHAADSALFEEAIRFRKLSAQ